MATVDLVFSHTTGQYKKQNNATLHGFHRAYSPRFRQKIGGKPDLWKWQSACRDFLTEWCPAKKPNDFKWKDSTTEDGNWTLTAAEIARISYVTTYQFASALLQHAASTAS